MNSCLVSYDHPSRGPVEGYRGAPPNRKPPTAPYSVTIPEFGDINLLQICEFAYTGYQRQS